MSGTNSQLVKDWRARAKVRMVKSMGGCCQICGYDKCNRALEFHHINPAEKSHSFGKIRASPQSWHVISEELKKCILLCSNCHKEVEAGITAVPETFAKYDASIEEEILAYKNKKSTENVRKYWSVAQ